MITGGHDREGDDWLKAVLESLVEGTVVVHPDGRVEELNDVAGRIPGLPLDELTDLEGRVPPGRLADAEGQPLPVEERPPFRTLQRGEETTGVVLTFRTPQGRRCIEVSSRAVVGRGRPAASISIVDVTDRYDQQQALEYRMSFEDLVMAISTRFVTLTPAELRPGIDRTLREIGTFLGAGRAYVFERDPAVDVYDETHEWCAPGVTGYRDTRRGVDAQVMPWWVAQLTRGDDLVVDDVSDLPPEAWREQRIFKSQGIAALACVPMLSGGRLRGFIGIDVLDGPRVWDTDTIRLLRVVGEIVIGGIEGTDAAERLARAAEETLRNNAELEQANERLLRANRAKDEFLSVASHELRTPLTTILGFVQTLKDRDAQLGPGQRLQFLEVLERQSARLSRLVENLLESSRIAAGRMGTEPADLTVGTLVAEVLADMGDRLGEVRTEGDLAAGVRVDGDHLRRMLTNLLENAAKYGRPPIEIAVEAADGVVRVAVRDHGDGVPGSFVPRLFERFSQASTGTTRSATGTGLGLSIVRDLARLNGGDVTYEPSGPGARFVLRLPAVRTPGAT